MKMKRLLIALILVTLVTLVTCTVINEREKSKAVIEPVPTAIQSPKTGVITPDTIDEPSETEVTKANIESTDDAEKLSVAGSIASSPTGIAEASNDAADNDNADDENLDRDNVGNDTQTIEIRSENITFKQAKVEELCVKTGNKLGSVSIEDCREQLLQASGYWTDQGHALAYKDYLPIEDKQVLGKVLVIGGIHADEYSAVSIIFKWMKILDKHHSGIVHWKFIPVSNPDGLFQTPATRQNGNGVDLNRNFPSSDWQKLALKYWKEKAYSSPRRYPGKYPASETETQWLVKVIGEFKPDIVVSVHAPYELLDYDGPGNAPAKIGDLYLSQLGVFPGSLGNYGGIDLAKPIVTLELPSAGSLPSPRETSVMWVDLVRWLIDKLNSLN